MYTFIVKGGLSKAKHISKNTKSLKIITKTHIITYISELFMKLRRDNLFAD